MKMIKQTNPSSLAGSARAAYDHTPRTRPWLLVVLFLTVAAFAMLAAPNVLWANNGTVPPPPTPELVTVLVGPVDSLADDGGSLVVAGVFISKTAETRVDERVGALAVGAWARVEGNGDGGGGLVAKRIKVLPPLPMIKLIGPLDSLADSNLTVDGISLNRTASTLIIGDPVAGEDTVGVRAALESTGDLLALQVIKIGDLPDEPDDDEDEDDPSKTLLTGEIDSMPDGSLIGTWVVSGIPVEVTADTKLHARVGLLAKGSWLKIMGHVEDGALIAERMKTTHSHAFHKLTGTLDQLNALEVVVDGIEIDLSDAASVRGNPQPGDRVRVKALRSLTGSLLAVLIEKRGGANSPGKPGLVVKFTARVDQLPDEGLYGTWKVAGRPLKVPEGALIDEHKGEVAVGAFVQVTAILGENGSLTAVEIVVVRGNDDDDDDDDHHGWWKEFTGKVESLPDNKQLLGKWVVDGVEVMVTRFTHIRDRDQQITVGDQVKVWGWRHKDGMVFAKRIELKEEHTPEIYFIGVITDLPDEGLVGDWMVDDRKVIVTQETELDDGEGEFVVGKRVKVRGHVQDDNLVVASHDNDGPVVATHIESLHDPEIQYMGAVVEFPNGLVGEWTIGERTVFASEETEFKQENGAFAAGVLIKVKGHERPDGAIDATRIETLSLPKIEYYGEIISLPDNEELIGLWEVGPLTFEVTAETELEAHDDGFAVGVWVKVKGRTRADGTLLADKIEMKHEHDDD
jgi:hypothetical protein